MKRMPFRSKVALVWGGLTTVLLLLKVLNQMTFWIILAAGWIWWIEEYLADFDEKLDRIIKILEGSHSETSQRRPV